MDNKNRLLVGGDKNQLFKTLQNQLVKEEESAIEEFSNVLYWGADILILWRATAYVKGTK